MDIEEDKQVWSVNFLTKKTGSGVSVNEELQSFTKYLRLTLIFMRNSALRKKILISVFQRFFCLYKQNFWSGRKTGH